MSSKLKENNNILANQVVNHRRLRSSSSILLDPRYHGELFNTPPTSYMALMKRKAIDLSGHVGNQYDAIQDKIVKNSRLFENSSSKITTTDFLPFCSFIKSEMINNDTLFKLLDIDDQSILNLLLNTNSLFTDGTPVTIINTKEWVGNRKRILFYRCLYEKESLPHKPKWNILEKNSLHENTTHLITTVLSGIELLVVLEISTELSMTDVDEQLYKFCLNLRTGQKFSDNDILLNYLDQLKIVHIYTNLPKFIWIKNISSIYDRIMKFNIRQSQPIFYQLLPIAFVYNKITNIIYRKINYGIILSVQTELLTLQKLFDEIESLISISNKSKIHQQQYEEIQQKRLNIEQFLINLIDNIHRGKKSDHELAEYFIQTDYRQWIIYLGNFIDNLRQINQSSNISLFNDFAQNSLNILLLGETGVGKSTFINALANYIRFESLKQVGENDPIVLIPTSFLMTTRTIKRTNPRITDFNEITIKFGKADLNEYQNDQGQSVTQQCKSYTISINHHTKLNIIDTPGIGDTRGITQDKINIQNILSFVQKLNHINAICILLKPNVERLHISFRVCLLQLFNILHSNIRKNIIFGFTNARSTLYMPGNTGILLDEMLKKLPGDRIILNKSNTFFFDSESFRYLAAIKQGIKFSEQQNRQYYESWMRSASETERFYKYIQSLKVYSIKTNEKNSSETEPTTCLF